MIRQPGNNSGDGAGFGGTAPIPRTLGKGGRIPKLDWLLEDGREHFDRILAAIQMGAYDHVAARAMGIHPRTFMSWMQKGRQAKKGKWRQFYEEVQEARSHARMMCEIQVRKDDPKFWLKHCAKTYDGLPGWDDESQQIEITHRGDEDSPIRLAPPRLVPQQQDITDMLEVLSDAGIIDLTNNPNTPALLGQITSSNGDEDEEGDPSDE